MAWWLLPWLLVLAVALKDDGDCVGGAVTECLLLFTFDAVDEAAVDGTWWWLNWLVSILFSTWFDLDRLFVEWTLLWALLLVLLLLSIGDCWFCCAW